MANADQDGWSKVKERLRADVGDDVYSSWFARMDLEGLEDKTVRLSVPTRFLKSWIQSHYAERVLACWQAHDNNIARIELTVRSAVLRTNIPVKPRETAPVVNGHVDGGRIMPLSEFLDAQLYNAVLRVSKKETGVLQPL